MTEEESVERKIAKHLSWVPSFGVLIASEQLDWVHSRLVQLGKVGAPFNQVIQEGHDWLLDELHKEEA